MNKLTIFGITLALVSAFVVIPTTSANVDKIIICHCTPSGCNTIEVAEQAISGHFDANGNPLHEGDHYDACVEPIVTPTIDATGTPTTTLTPTVELTPAIPTLTLTPSPEPTAVPTQGVSEQKWESIRAVEGTQFGANK